MITQRLGTIYIRELLRLARNRNASDLHITPGETPTLRVDGTLIRLETQTYFEEALLARCIDDLLDDKARCALRERGDADIALRDEELGAFRVHAFRSLGHSRLAIRLLAQEIPALERILPSAPASSLIERQAGLVLFVGPTGSGKTTSLAALIDRINRTTSKHIITIEDPVEYTHRSIRSIITHRELGSDVAAYADAVRSCLRADPDVLLIGELRDAPTMAAALSAAETGHLVFSTLHTADAPQTIDRIVDSFSGGLQSEIRAQLAHTLAAVISVRLVPRASGRGRIAAVEILTATDAVRTLIRDGKTHQLRNVMQTGRACGMQTLETHLCELVMRREITLEAAKAATDRPGELRTLSGSC